MTKTLIIIGGVPGSGKTYHRTHTPSLMTLPYVDIADVYADHPMRTDDYTIIYAYFIKRVKRLLETHDTVVGEGLFIPYSQTRGWLVADCRYDGIEVQFIDCHASLRTCTNRIEQSADREKMRIAMLKRVWPKAATYYFDESEREYVYSLSD